MTPATRYKRIAELRDELRRLENERDAARPWALVWQHRGCYAVIRVGSKKSREGRAIVSSHKTKLAALCALRVQTQRYLKLATRDLRRQECVVERAEAAETAAVKAILEERKKA